MKTAMSIAEVSPTVKTKSLQRGIKRGAADGLLAALPKDASIKRQIQRQKYKINMATVDTKSLADMIIPGAVQITIDGQLFLRCDSRLVVPGIYCLFNNYCMYYLVL